MKSKKVKADDSAVDNDHVQVIEKKKRKRRVNTIDDVDVGVTEHADKSVSNKKKHRVSAETVDDRVAVVDKVDEVTFASFGLDERLLKAIAELGWERPTIIQEKMIPLALEGKDIVARARTGSGKTAAFAVPLIQMILERKSLSNIQSTAAVIIAPTKELCTQIASHIIQLTSSCSLDVRLLELSSIKDVDMQKQLLADIPDIVIGTPSKLIAHMNTPTVTAHLQFVIMDEADLLFSFGYEQEMRTIISALPSSYQAILTSATLTADIETLKKLALHNPVTLKLEEAQLPDASQLTQYHICCEEEDRFVLLYALIKLRLIQGKTIIFVANTDRCYRLRLFLEQFGITSCVLNSEMPVNSRCHIVAEFNNGHYDYVIASDHADLATSTTAADDAIVDTNIKKKPKRRKVDKESGVSRGIDFHHVANVINFDFPPTVDAYIHRVGRTARGWNKGTALSFAVPSERHILDEVVRVLNEQLGANVLKPYEFRMEELDGFRYRARDVLHAVTSTAIRETRLAEIKKELKHSKKLESYFAKNPREIAALEHDKTMHTVKVHSSAIKDVPDYLVPPTLRGNNYHHILPGSKHSRIVKPRITVGMRKYQQKQNDPLQSFSS